MATTTGERARPSAAGVGLAARRLSDGLAGAGARLGLAGPVLVVAAVLGILLVQQLAGEHWNLLGLVQFGRVFAPWTHPPGGVPNLSPMGYDGQFYWVQAHDPLLLSHRTLIGMSHFSPGIQRFAYPALAFLLAGGQPALLPAGLLAVNVLSVLGVTAVVAAEARRRGRSPWWALAVGLTPGLLLATLRDLSDPLALAAMIAGLVAWQRGRTWSCAGLLTLAALAREPMIAAVVAVAGDAALAAWRGRRIHGRRLALARRALPALVVPVLVFVAWQVYIRHRWTGATGVGHGGLAPTPSLHPYGDFVAEARRAVGEDSPIAAAWDLAYLGLLAVAMLTSGWLALRRPRAAALLAVGLSLLMAVVIFGDEWGLSRYGAPVFALLVLAGLEGGRRGWLLPAVLAVGLTPLIPMMIPGV